MGDNESLTHVMTTLVLQLSVITIAASLFGRIAVKAFKQPSVLGELVAGMVIGPYALGGILKLGGRPLFEVVQGAALPVSPQLYGFATVASIVLLFLSGLETDIKTFLRLAGTGTLTGLGDVVLSFFLGAGSAVLFIPGVDGFLHPVALFMGIMTPTSVGIGARILSDQRKLSSPEGVTILSAAVLDDVFGIVMLAVVVAFVRSGNTGNGSSVNWAEVGWIGLKAFGFWLISTAISIQLAPRIVRGLKKLRDLNTLTMISFGLALMLAGFSERMGLAMIVGAYVMGLALSGTDVAGDLRKRLEGLHNFIVPIFFCVMGMLVDFSALPKIFVYGLIYTALTTVGKLVGCGLPALMTGFNVRGALRIGVGMIPRGEVTLITAGIGLSMGVIDPGLFSVAITCVLISSLITPPLLARVFSDKNGFRKSLNLDDKRRFNTITLQLPSDSLADFVTGRILNAFQQAEFFPRRIDPRRPVYMVQKDSLQMTLHQEGSTLSVNVPPDQEGYVRLLLTEELLELKELFRNVETLADSNAVERDILSGLFGGETQSPSAPDGDSKDEPKSGGDEPDKNTKDEPEAFADPEDKSI